MSFNTNKLFLSVLLTLLSISIQLVGFAQDKKLTFTQVYLFEQPRILDRLPSLKGWFDGNYYLQTKKEDDKTFIMKVNAKTGEEKIYVDYAMINENLEYGLDASKSVDVTNDYNDFLFTKDSDLYYYSVPRNEFKRLTQDEAIENNPTLSPDGKKAVFTKEHNLFVVDTESGEVTQLTFDGTDDIYNGWASWVYMEEILGRSTRHKAYWWSPNSEMIAFLHTDDSPVPKFPIFSSKGVHGKLEWERYPKAGDPNANVKLGVVNLKNKNIVWVEEDETVDQYTAWPFWTPDSKELFYQVLNRGQDTLQILSADPFTGRNRDIYTETQQSWVEFFEDIYLFENGSGFILRSDKDGWRHLYYYDMNGTLISRITEGDWQVEEIKYVDEDNGVIYFEGWVHNSLNKNLFRVKLDGSDFERLTDLGGTHNTTISPGGKFFYDSYSNINQPPKLELFDSNGQSVRVISDSKTKIFDEYDLGTTELFIIPTEDGVELPAVWVLPPGFDKTKKYPVIFSVYGGPERKDVKNNFSSYLNRFFTAQNGIIYFKVDHRGSKHFGKKGTSLMHRNLGKWEMNDYIEAVKWLKKQPFIDSTKVGITGGSYGGYLAAFALTYGADYFTHGIAEYSVTDWRLYDNIYTERFMDTPEENPEGYEFGSAMTHAEKYKGHLLITHGTLDDNVHLQNTLQLVDKLTDLDKDFELMLYPNSGHGVRFPKWIHAKRNAWNFWYRHFFGKEFVKD
ncbi:MAG: S9 family peptidase [Ignavibacteria bacterium]|nr:MAG: S9 family peptidase [Ignavibacteria bacterium]